MHICGTPSKGVRRWSTGRMAVRSAAALIRKIHSFGRSRGNAHLRHSFRRSSEVEHGQNGCTECCCED